MNIQEHRHSPYHFTSHVKFILNHPLDFASRIFSQKNGLDTTAKLYQSYYSAINVISVRCKSVGNLANSVNRLLKSIPIFEGLSVIEAAGSLSKLSDRYISVNNLANVFYNTNQILTKDANGKGFFENNSTRKVTNIFFLLIVGYCDAFAFVKTLAEAQQPSSTFWLFRNTAFVISCIAGLYEFNYLMYNSSSAKEEQRHEMKWRNINLNSIKNTEDLVGFYKGKIKSADSKQLEKIESWQKKIKSVENGDLKVEYFKNNVLNKCNYWHNKKNHVVENFKNIRNCILFKLCSLILNISNTLFRENECNFTSFTMINFPISKERLISYIPEMLAVTNFTLSHLNLHRYSFEQYFVNPTSKSTKDRL